MQANISNVKEGTTVRTKLTRIQYIIVKMSGGKLAIRRKNVIIDLSEIVDPANGDLMGFEIVDK